MRTLEEIKAEIASAEQEHEQEIAGIQVKIEERLEQNRAYRRLITSLRGKHKTRLRKLYEEVGRASV